MTSGAGAAGHSLAFRVMRLCRPSCSVEQPLLFDPADLFNGEDLQKPTISPSDDFVGYSNRLELQQPMDAMGLSGLIILPQTFGSIYLGETFCSYISVGNHTNHDVRDVIIKAELQTERKPHIVLSDNTKNPIDSIRATGRFDFIIEHDIKELGGHTLVCMAIYTDADGERKYLPQYFRFTTSNPVAVRTKLRVIKDTSFLEACIENQTKSHLFMDHVRFDPEPQWTAKPLEIEQENSSDGPISDYIKNLKLVSGNGGAQHYLFQLTRSATKVDEDNALGKLEILWRTTLGETGRLQTQKIMGAPVPRKDVEINMVELPSRITLHRPFLARVSVRNHTDSAIGPLRVTMSEADDDGIPNPIIVNGLWSLIIPRLDPHMSTDLDMNLVATSVGVQRIGGISVADVADSNKFYDLLPPSEVFVEHELH